MTTVGDPAYIGGELTYIYIDLTDNCDSRNPGDVYWCLHRLRYILMGYGDSGKADVCSGGGLTSMRILGWFLVVLF